MKKYKSAMIRGICNGVLCALFINMWVIISFFININDVVFDLMGLPLGISVFLLMKQTRIKSFLISWLFNILFYVLTEIIIGSLDIIHMFYHISLGDVDSGIRMSAGEGFGIMVINFYIYFWIIVETLLAFIFTVVKQIKTNKKQIANQEAEIQTVEGNGEQPRSI